MGQQELVEIQPQELQFTFELKKQSSCSIQLVNKSNDYVAFKVKTTSPKRYCVRPNVGIILPRSTCDFTVTMQAQKEPPPDMQLKDKFLVQTTIVPNGTTDEDIVPSFFSKESGRYIQENKMRVVLVSPPQSPVPISSNGTLKQEPAGIPVSEMTILNDGVKNTEPAYVNPFLSTTSLSSNETVKQEQTYESPVLKTTSTSSTVSLKHEHVSESPISKDTSMLTDQAENVVADILPTVVAKDVDELKLKLNNLEGKLNEAETTIMRLREENNDIIQGKDKLHKEIAFLRRKSAARVHSGFPPLFVVFMALVGLVLGYLWHS